MKNQLIQAIEIRVKPSLVLLGALSLISILSCLVLLALPIPLMVKWLMITIVICSSFYYTLRDALHLLPWSWQTITVSSRGQLRLSNQRGEQFTPVLQASCFIHHKLIVINAKSLDQQHSIKRALPPVIIFLQADSQQHRQLRVWLRWWQHES